MLILVNLYIFLYYSKLKNYTYGIWCLIGDEITSNLIFWYFIGSGLKYPKMDRKGHKFCPLLLITKLKKNLKKKFKRSYHRLY